MRIGIAVMTGLIGLGAAAPSFAALSSTDKNFATKAAKRGLAEVQVGQLAQKKGDSVRAKQLGQTLVQDHTQANQQLEQIAQQNNVDLPQQPSSTDAVELKKLQSLSGSQFDKQFASAQVQDHRQDIIMFEREAKSGKDPDLKSFAQQTLPVLRKHLQMAQALQRGSQQ